MGNGKRGNGILHFTQQTADILLLQSSNVTRKLMSIQHLLKRSAIPYGVHQRVVSQARPFPRSAGRFQYVARGGKGLET